MKKTRGSILLAMTALALLAAAPVDAQTPSPKQDEVDASTMSQANNPLANMTAINLQDYYSPSLYGLPDATSNTMNFRGVMARGRQIIRATLPLSTVPTGQASYATGLGDLNIFDAIILNPGSTTQVGVGPLLVMPTATDDALGVSSTWQAGAAAVVVHPLEGGSLVGGLVTWQTDFAGGDNRVDTNLMSVQYFLTMSIGKGWYLRSTPLAVLNFQDDVYLVPFGLGVGKVFPVGGAVVNAFVEPQVSIYHKGRGLPSLQVFLGLNFQFPSR
jgi:hypothetical protein